MTRVRDEEIKINWSKRPRKPILENRHYKAGDLFSKEGKNVRSH